MMALPDETVTDADGWLDYDVGATFNVFGALESVGYGSPGSIIIRFADWAQLVIITTRPREIPMRLGTHVMVRVVRTEDGMDATAIWELGGVPVPLV